MSKATPISCSLIRLPVSPVTIRRARLGLDVSSVTTCAAPSRYVLVTDLVTVPASDVGTPVA